MWILDSLIFARWLETEKQTLFCPGIPGAGKTIMAASVIAKLQNELRHGDGGLAYIYCTYNERHTARDLIALILQQLSSQLPAIPQKVKELYTAHKVHRPSLQMNDLRSALISVLSCFPKVLIVIDAIDECQDDKNRAELLEAVSELKPHANILVTSRHSGTIANASEGDVWLQIEASTTDIEMYVGSEIQMRDFGLSDKLAGDPILRSRIVNEVMTKSRRM
jgi:Cdc6-like AAA superfamily ATPase